ncbi:hypothetical protein AcW1_008466 [Taiwanofungus camphoratus]|nr:hypothetical protein AcW1_008466 [Antrodia cinnamomea]
MMPTKELHELQISTRPGEISGDTSTQTGSTGAKETKETPLPKLQLCVLLYVQLAEPITSTVVYPFVNQLVRTTGATGGDDRKTGYFAGLIESSFYATEAICILQWGRASDRVGRKPVLLGGLFGLTLSMIGFGLSRSYWALILSRCAEGALNGNVGVTKSMMAEITDPTNRARGFAFLPMIWSLGSTIGPLIGGVLSTPADHWPRTFRSKFWSKFPYFLPCIVAASISISAFVMTLVGLKETLPRPIRQRDAATSSMSNAEDTPLPRLYCGTAVHSSASASEHKRTDTFSHDVMMEEEKYGFDKENSLSRSKALDHDSVAVDQANTPAHPQEPRSIGIRSILVPQVLLPILNYGFLAFTDQSIVVLQPLMYSTLISQGGLSFSSFKVGVVQGVTGVVSGVLQILTFARMHRRFGTKKLYIASFACFFLCIVAFPLMSLVAKHAGRVDAATWVLIVLQNAAYCGTFMTWGCIFMYISDAAPDRTALGLTNGLAQTTASTVRALAPSTASSLFSVSLEKHLAGGTLVYWILCIVAAGGFVASWWLPQH